MAPALMWRQVGLGQQTLRNDDKPKPRHGHRAVVIKDLIVVFGGGNGGVVEDLHVFNTSNEQWFKPAVKGDIPRGYAAHGFLVDGTLMLMYGGMMEYGKYSNDLYALQATRWEWKQLKPRAPRNAKPPCHRLGHSFNLVDKRVYLFGGLSNDSVDPRSNHPRYLNDLYTLDRTGNSVAWDKPTTSGPLPAPRESHSGVAYSNKRTGTPYLVIYGGMNGMRLDDVWMLDCESMTWSNPLPGGCSPLARSLHCASVVGRHMYVLGGWVSSWPRAAADDTTDDWHCTDVLSRLDLEAMTWENVETDGEDGTPPPRAGSVMVNVDSRQYVWSGRDGYRSYMNKQVCFDDMWYIEVDVPQPPGRAQLVKTETNALDLCWSPPGRAADFYRLEVMLYNHPPPAASHDVCSTHAGEDAAAPPGGGEASSPGSADWTSETARTKSVDGSLVSPTRAACPGSAGMVNPGSAKNGSPGLVLKGSPGSAESPGWCSKQSPGFAKNGSPRSAKKKSHGSAKKGSPDVLISPGWGKKKSPGRGKNGSPARAKKEKPGSSKKGNPAPATASPGPATWRPSPPKPADNKVHGLVHLPTRPPPPAGLACGAPAPRVRMLSTRPPIPPLLSNRPLVPLTLGQAHSVIAQYQFPTPAAHTRIVRMLPMSVANPPPRLVRMTNVTPRGCRGGYRPRMYGPRAPRKQYLRAVKAPTQPLPPTQPPAASSRPLVIRLTAGPDGSQVLTMATAVGFKPPGIVKGIVPAAPGQPRVLVVPRAQPAFASRPSSEEAATVAAGSMKPPRAAVTSNAGEGCVAAPEGAAAIGAAEQRTVGSGSNPSEGGYKTEVTEVTEEVKTELTTRVKAEPTEGVEVEPTEGVEVEPTEGVEVELTEGVEIELTEGIEVELTEAVEVELTKGVKVELTEGVEVELTEGVKAYLTAGARTESLRGVNPRLIQGVKSLLTQGLKPKLIRGVRSQLIRGGNLRPVQGISPRPIIRGVNLRFIQGVSPQLIRGVNPRPVLGISPQPIRGVYPRPIRGVNPRPIRGIIPRLIQIVYPQLIQGVNLPLNQGVSPPPNQGVDLLPTQGGVTEPKHGVRPPPNQGVGPQLMKEFMQQPIREFTLLPERAATEPTQGANSLLNRGAVQPPTEAAATEPATTELATTEPMQGANSLLNREAVQPPTEAAATEPAMTELATTEPTQGANSLLNRGVVQPPTEAATTEAATTEPATTEPATTEPTQGANWLLNRGVMQPPTEAAMTYEQIERANREADHDYVLPRTAAVPGPPSTVKIAKLSGGGGIGGGARLTWLPNASDPAAPLDYAVYMAVRSISSPPPFAPAQLAFARVYVGAEPLCLVSEQVLANAQLDTRGRPAVVFRITARNAAGSGPATQVKWLQAVDFGAAAGDGRKVEEDGGGGVVAGGRGGENGGEEISRKRPYDVDEGTETGAKEIKTEYE